MVLLSKTFYRGYKVELKDVIKAARLDKNLKQEDVAEKAKVTVQTYRKWEGGKTEPKASQVALLSKALGVSTDAICNGQESKKLNMMEFMRINSKISQGISDFDQKMALWESIDDDYKYLNMLLEYNEFLDEMPDPIKETENMIKGIKEKELKDKNTK